MLKQRIDVTGTYMKIMIINKFIMLGIIEVCTPGSHCRTTDADITIALFEEL